MIEYRYRKHIRCLQYAAPALCALLILAAWAGAFLCSRSAPRLLPPLRNAAALATAFFGAEGLFLWYLMRRFALVRVRLEDAGIAYESSQGAKFLPFADIVDVECSTARYLVGWVKIRTADDSIRLTIVLERIGDFIRRLKAALDAGSRRDLYDPRNLFRFYKTAEFADQSWERLYENLPALSLAWALSLAAGYAALLPLHPLLRIFAAFSALAAAQACYVAAEFWIARRVAGQADEAAFTCPLRDRGLEKRVYLGTAALFAALFLAAAGFVLPRLH